MAATERPQERPNQNATVMLNSLVSGLSAEVLQETGRGTESLDSVLFAFNPWCPIPNIELKGFLFGVQYVVLPRLDLIPLKVWKTPVIQPRVGGFAVGAISSGGAFPSGAVGSKVDQRLQFPSESARNLLGAYGSDSPNNIGFTVFRSLGADTDAGKLESILLFRAVMKTPLEDGAQPGVDQLLEELPKFLAGDAVTLLRRAVDKGVVIDGEVAKLSRTAARKGEVMIEDIRLSVANAAKRALDENSGILPLTKKSILAAEKGLQDNKVMPDELDNWLLRQFPSFSLDTAVERASRANRSITDAILAKGGDDQSVLRELLIMQQQTLEQLARSNAITERLMKEREAKAS